MVSGVCQIKEDFNEINDDFRALGGGIDTSQVTNYIEKNLNLNLTLHRAEVDEMDTNYNDDYNQMLGGLMSPKSSKQQLPLEYCHDISQLDTSDIQLRQAVSGAPDFFKSNLF